jgi:hypothetical protein
METAMKKHGNMHFLCFEGLFYFILLDLPTRAGSPQQHKPITVGPFT